MLPRAGLKLRDAFRARRAVRCGVVVARAPAAHNVRGLQQVYRDGDRSAGLPFRAASRWSGWHGSGPCRRSGTAATARPVVVSSGRWLPLESSDAHTYSWYLRHLHGWGGRHCPRGGLQGHRLRRQRLPADERSAARAGHRPDRGLGSVPAVAQARCLGGGQRGAAGQSADGSHSGCRAALRLGAAVAGRAGAGRALGDGRGRHARQDHHRVAAGLDPSGCRARAGLPDRWCTGQLPGLGASGAQALFRHRGR